jgi:putative NADH-flavin reductase
MKIALIGGTGFVGTAVRDELLQRGHTVTALARDPGRYAPHERLAAVRADATDAAQVADAVRGHDAVVSAFNPGWQDPEIYAHFLQGSRAILDGVRRSGVTRVLVVGGAGSLFVAPGVQGVDTPDFPAAWKQGALAARDLLTEIRREAALDWTFVSPAALLEPGPRTGRFRLGTEQMLMDGDHPAKLSVADLAVAIVDELETPKHVKQRFTAAY